MRREKILEILGEQNFWFREQNTGIPRKEYLSVFMKKIKTEEILVVSGIRRCGKSVLMLQTAENLIEKGVNKRNILIVNFEDYRWEDYTIDILKEIWATYLQNIWQKGKIYLFLDEVHVIPKWEKFVRTIYDKKQANIFITGSSSKLLSKEYATLLSGRHLELNVSPLSFNEFLVFNNFSVQDETEAIVNRNKILRLLNEYIKTGGFPKIVLTIDKVMLTSYFETIIIKDVVERYRIKNIDKLRKLAVFYLTNLSSKITFNSTSKFLNLPLHTVERFSYYLQEAYLCHFINAFSYSLKSQEKLPKKLYVVDTGLSNSVGFKFSENIGRLMENIVFTHLKNREVYYYPEGEVDFVIKEGLKIKQFIQVTYANNISEIKEREIKSLLKASKELKCNNLLIITWDYEGEEKIKGKNIIYKPLWKWLLFQS